LADQLSLSRSAFRSHALISGGVLIAIAMTLVVFADYSDWPGVLVCSALLAAGLYFFGTLGYRLQPRRAGRAQINTMLGSHQVDLRNGYRLKRGARIHTLRVGRKRYRLSGGLGEFSAIEDWLASAAEREHDLG
jgi:hypothetical protein